MSIYSLKVLDSDSSRTLNKLVTTAQRLIHLKRDDAMVEERTSVPINAINKK